MYCEIKEIGKKSLSSETNSCSHHVAFVVTISLFEL